jgi:hypothetical protein
MEQTRRPGRPAAKQEVSEDTTQLVSIETNKPILSHDYKAPEGPQNAMYEIKHGGGIAYMLSQSSVTVYDKSKDTIRQIRYCPNEPSIFVDEQSSNAKKEAVIFRNGHLMAPYDKPNLKRFLDLHPSNTANGGSVFSKVNNAFNIEKELEQEFNVFDSVALVREKSIDELLPVAIYYGVSIDRPVSDIKYDLLKIAKSKPNDFVSAFDNPIVKTRSIIHKASQYQVVNLRNDGCYWTDSNGLIVAVPVGQDPLDTLTRFCMTERGASVMSTIEDRLVNT